jgi:uncharacterized membrane protein YraQ (UPF0718 family)
MIEPVLEISQFIAEAFLHIWPYVIVTVPLAVAVQMSGASRFIKRAFEAGPLIAILLATLVGAFSPFCSCGVIPVIASLLIGGVPLAPVMSFWIASPSMDPEIFFLSVGMIGWELAIWRLAATLALSLAAGFITHLLVQNGWLGEEILRARNVAKVQLTAELLKNGWQRIKDGFSAIWPSERLFSPRAANAGARLRYAPVLASAKPEAAAATCSCSAGNPPLVGLQPAKPQLLNTSAHIGFNSCEKKSGDCNGASDTFRRRLFKETLKAFAMVIKFMALAFFLEALIILYVPQEWTTAVLGQKNAMTIVFAAILGVPTYTSNLTALPMIGGLLTQGMNPAAALTFLIAGPTTTLPAMAAVWPLVTRRVFGLYVTYCLAGAMLIGYFYRMAATWF